MKIGKPTVHALLLALISLNILIRLPRGEHEIGVDSFFIHNLATTISDRGFVPWVLNPLGYFGWYPLSYPTAGPFLISGLSQVGNLSEEGAILFLSIFYGVLSVLVAFAMARAFRPNDRFALTVALVFSLAPRFVNFTLWSASTRNLFMVLIPILLLAMIRGYRRPTPSSMLVLISVLILMIATHRLTILLAVVVIAFVVAYVFLLVHRVARIQFPRLLLSPRFRRWTPWLALLSIVLIAAFMMFGTSVLEEYSAGEVCFGSSVQAQVCNLSVSVTRSVGLALPLAIVGVFEIVRQHNKGFVDVFLVLSLLALIPTLFLRQYTGFYILPFLALFAGIGLLGILRLLSKHRRLLKVVLVASLLIIVGTAVLILQVEVERSTTMSGSSYTTALYMRTLPRGNFVANEGLLGIRVSSISGYGALPVGGAGVTGQSPELLIMGAYSAQEVFARETRIPLAELTIEDDSPFLVQGIDARADWQLKILYLDVDQVTVRTVNQYGIQYYLENRYFEGAYTAYNHVYKGVPFSNFIMSTYAERYKIFDTGAERLYLTFPPL